MTSTIRTATGFLIVDGQSLNNLPSGNTWSAQMVTEYLPNLRRSNVAVDGTSWTYLTRDRTTRRDPHLRVGAVNILTLIGGQSDIGIGVSVGDADSGAQVYADMKAYADSARAVSAGLVVVGATIPPSTAYTGGQNTQRLAANALIVANGDNAFDEVVDLANVSGLDNAASANYDDGLHFSIAGAGLCADAMAPVIIALLAA